jgi:hypothetical protein
VQTSRNVAVSRLTSAEMIVPPQIDGLQEYTSVGSPAQRENTPSPRLATPARTSSAATSRSMASMSSSRNRISGDETGRAAVSAAAPVETVRSGVRRTEAWRRTRAAVSSRQPSRHGHIAGVCRNSLHGQRVRVWTDPRAVVVDYDADLGSHACSRWLISTFGGERGALRLRRK